MSTHFKLRLRCYGAEQLLSQLVSGRIGSKSPLQNTNRKDSETLYALKAPPPPFANRMIA